MHVCVLGGGERLEIPVKVIHGSNQGNLRLSTIELIIKISFFMQK